MQQLKVHLVSFLIITLLFVPKTGSSQVNQQPGEEREIPEHFRLEHLQEPQANFVMVVAHRGAWQKAPENSLKSIEDAIVMGVDMVEIDVRKTKDGVFILMHDKTINRTTNGKGKVSDKTYGELQNYRLKYHEGELSNESIPTLEQALTCAKGRILVNLDKSENYIQDIYPILQEYNMTRQVVFKGTHSVKAYREKFGSISDSIIYMPIITKHIPEMNEYISDFEETIDPSAYEVLFANTQVEAFEYLSVIRKNGDNLWINALFPSHAANRTDKKALKKPDENWGWIIEKGATIIQTDNPEELIHYLKGKGLH